MLLGDIAPPPTLNFRLRAWTAQADKATKIASDLALAVGQALGKGEVKGQVGAASGASPA